MLCGIYLRQYFCEKQQKKSNHNNLNNKTENEKILEIKYDTSNKGGKDDHRNVNNIVGNKYGGQQAFWVLHQVYDLSGFWIILFS